MKKKLLIIAGLAILVSCGKSEEEKTKDKVDNGNAKISRLNALNTELAGHGVGVGSGDAISSFISTSYQSDGIEAKDYETCLEIKKLLSEYVSKGRSVLSLADDKNIILTSEYRLKGYVSNASEINSNTTCTQESNGDVLVSANESEEPYVTEPAIDYEQLLKDAESRLRKDGNLKFITEEEFSTVTYRTETLMKFKFVGNLNVQDSYEFTNKTVEALDAFIKVADDVYQNGSGDIDNVSTKLQMAKRLKKQYEGLSVEFEIDHLEHKVFNSAIKSNEGLPEDRIANLKEALADLDRLEELLDSKYNKMKRREISEKKKQIDTTRESLLNSITIIESENKPVAENDGDIEGMDMIEDEGSNESNDDQESETSESEETEQA